MISIETSIAAIVLWDWISLCPGGTTEAMPPHHTGEQHYNASAFKHTHTLWVTLLCPSAETDHHSDGAGYLLKTHGPHIKHTHTHRYKQTHTSHTPNAITEARASVSVSSVCESQLIGFPLQRGWEEACWTSCWTSCWASCYLGLR